MQISERLAVAWFSPVRCTCIFVDISPFNHKTAGGSIWTPSTSPPTHPFPCDFSKNVSSKERVFCEFRYYHKSYLSWKFHWSSSSCSEVMKNLSVNLSYFHQFSSIFFIILTFLVTKKVLTSVCDKRCNHFFTFNIL